MGSWTLTVLSVFFACFTLAGSAFGESDKGTLQGTVFNPVGVPQANAPVQAKNAGTGTIYKAVSSPAGTYTLPDLPAGKYDVTVAIGGLKPYTRKDVGVQAAKVQQFDIKLEETTQFSTLGEDPLAIAADAKQACASFRADAAYGEWKARSLRDMVVSPNRRPR